jgi:hypothetical protein
MTYFVILLADITAIFDSPYTEFVLLDTTYNA